MQTNKEDRQLFVFNFIGDVSMTNIMVLKVRKLKLSEPSVGYYQSPFTRKLDACPLATPLSLKLSRARLDY